LAQQYSREVVPITETPSGLLTFTVDSALLRELGERLVGKAHIALAELIKNSFDADATVCEIIFGIDSIEIIDNGHGMTLSEFERFWMRVGTTHKQAEQFSRDLGRPLTGSKGVGRLAVQFLADHVSIQSAVKNSTTSLQVTVDWNSAIQHEFLTQAQAKYQLTNSRAVFANGASHGFRVILSGLTQEWDERSLQSLAKEIWTLRPPFDGYAGKGIGDKARDFSIKLTSIDSDAQNAFEAQINAASDVWIAKVEGLIENGHRTCSQTVTITFVDGETTRRTFDIPDCSLNSASWEIRIFNLSGHLGSSIKVHDAREYFAEFGGVHVYDGPFRLPYYGIQQDWLGIEYDHSHRKVKSKLLPTELHVERALNDLPTQGRILGVVRVDTGAELRSAQRRRTTRDFLKIQVTRDRLQINKAYEQLRDAVRLSIDFYAVCSMSRRIQAAELNVPTETMGEAANRVERTLDNYSHIIPRPAYNDLKSEIATFVDSSKRDQDYKDAKVALLGPLAAAGMSAIALEHETGRQLSLLTSISDRLELKAAPNSEFALLAGEIKSWITNFKQLRRVFEPLASQEDREETRPMRAGKVLQLVYSSMKPFLTGVHLEREIPSELYLPTATLAEWQGLFQNVITNALNAMLSSPSHNLKLSAGRGPGRKGWVRVSDSGIGIDVEKSNEYFEPFKRSGELSAERKSLGLGGHGLGLTIVRMIAENRNCRVAFVSPEPGYSTTFELRWTLHDN
jgi:signal transduction histidine kinase